MPNHNGSVRRLFRRARGWLRRLPWGAEAGLQKYDIVNALVRKNGYHSYLEICTPTTGGRFWKVDRRSLRTCHRLLYRCPDDFEDGQEITFRSAGESLANLPDPMPGYDIVLVDPWHTLEPSLRDLHLGFSLLRRGGTMVVHDCSPPTREAASPLFHEGPWCGVTYRAYLEFVLSSGLFYYTVDADYGCGVVQRNRDGEAARRPATRRAQQWRDLLNRDGDLFDSFSRHRRELLNLVSVEEFLLAENLRTPLPVRCSNLLRRGRARTSMVSVQRLQLRIRSQPRSQSSKTQRLKAR